DAFKGRRYAGDLSRLSRLLDALADDEVAVAERVEAAVRYYEPLLKKHHDDFPRRKRDLEALEGIAQRYRSLERFLSDVALEAPQFSRRDPGRDPEEEWMTLSTVHSAKGLEWHTVFVVNLNSGHFPSQQSLFDDEALEEERRLFYVAVTRAKRNLYLLRPEELPRRTPYGDTFAEISPLLEEIGGLERLVDSQDYHLDPEAELWADEDGTQGADPALLSRIQDYFGK
ncbi:MAG: ATP-dependent helicase, partial [Acidobacteria bacterium]|nr:ATP-dependent helicase [Acidobacteriota bacterium]